MAQVSLRIGETVHEVACRDGGEARLKQAAALIDERWASARRAAGAGGVNRAFLMVSLMLADALIDERQKPPPETPEAAALERLAARIEELAQALETQAP